MGSVGEVVWYLHADSHNMKWYYAYRVVARYYDNRFWSTAELYENCSSRRWNAKTLKDTQGEVRCLRDNCIKEQAAFGTVAAPT